MKSLLIASAVIASITTTATANTSHYLNNLQSGWTLSGNVEVVDNADSVLLLQDNIDNDLQLKLYESAFHNNKVVILAKDNEIRSEYYNVSPPSKNLTPGGNSMSKSVLSLLVGKAMCRGDIDIDQTADQYLNSLKGTSWGSSTIKQLMMMSSGAYFAPSKLYGHASKDMQRELTSPMRSARSKEVISFLKQYDKKYRTPGKQFTYSNADTMIVGLVLREATGRSVYDLTQDLWQEVGAEYNATWLVNSQDQTMSYMGFAAKPEDWLRLGIFVNDAYQKDDCFAQYLKEATSTQIDYPEPYESRDYGYFIWTKCAPANPDSFCFIGALGQMLMIDPTYDTVLYVHSTSPKWGGVNHWGLYFWQATAGKNK